jgi:hypothetical protein
VGDSPNGPDGGSSFERIRKKNRIDWEEIVENLDELGGD